MSARRPPSLPPEIAGFSYVELLGSGGFADVFLYEQRMPRRRVAIKVLLPETLSAGARASFDAEANLMAQLSTHPSIVTIYQADISADGRPYLAMEYCPRPNLGARYRREKIGVAEVLRIGVQVAGAVETSHRAGILHRDIKPANILTTEYNRPALTDFGISVALVGGDERESVGMSIPWSPPEVFDQTPTSNAAADIYSLGATVYTLLAGRSPFELPGASNAGLDLIARIQSGRLEPTGRADVPESLERVLAIAMSRRETDRYSSALEFARALQKVQLELSLSVTPADVLDDALPARTEEDEDDGNTRIRGIVTIDPTAPAPTAPAPALRAPVAPMAPVPPVIVPPRIPEVSATADGDTVRPQPSAATPAGPGPAAPPVEETVRREQRPAGNDPQPSEAPARRSRLPLLIGGAAVLVVVVVLGVVFAVNSGGGSPAAQVTSSADAPVDIQPAERVPAVSGITAETSAAGVVFTWQNPKPEAGDVFLWGTVTPGAEPKLVAITEPTVTVPAAASGQVCIEVSIRRTDGRASDPVTKCQP
ncbi:hypothetical protein B7R54_00275 [Subtercola boreus]|uniref:non-specific serine/threonine protein kinase n=1 Tax=Subtercola boreus TaxID=120213 RepID=A0A3E0VEC3_9MICO|nr:serine/threonine-protein kinase [Subtercola boreus]RFA07818.1 hypothetical protein B7R54_00275 [Subtercola boreus]TQL55334.1 serine/threonine protein kinase [Subtercola boreus]